VNLTQLKLRDKLVCKLADGDGSEFVIRIEDIVDDENVLTDLPIVHSGKVHFRKNTTLDLVYTNNQGVYYFQGRVIEFTPDNNFMLIKKISSGGRVQRRNYFRLEVNPLCTTRILANFFTCKKITDNCVVHDISAGGIKIMTNSRSYQPGELYYLAMDDFQPLKSVWAEVLSVEPISLTENVAFINFVSLQFVYLKSRETDELVRLLMYKQREISRLITE